MYKVFVNDITLFLTDNINHYEQFEGGKIKFASKKKLKKTIHQLDSTIHKSYCIYHFDLDELFYYFRRTFSFIKAAGGLVQNEEGKYLFIFRKGHWDIPKGKMEKNEIPEETAVREVEEECGVRNLIIQDKIVDTYHTYSFGDELCLKKTYWFFMKTTFDGKLVAQIEEDISEVKWMSLEEAAQYEDITFNGVLEVIEVFKSQNRSV